MKLMAFIFCASALLLSSACTHALHQYHVSDHIAPGDNYEATKISAEAVEKNHIFKTDTVHADKAFEMLKQECPKGIITGINTRHSTSHGFFGWKDKIKMTAYCLKEKPESISENDSSKSDIVPAKPETK